MERCGFFDANLAGEEYDRVYLASQFAAYFASFIGNGIFAKHSNQLQVVEMSTPQMQIGIERGQAWINGYWYENTDMLYMPIDVADGVLNRVDSVVLRLGFSERNMWLAVKKGTPAVNPVAPEVTRTADYYELQLATISIPAGSIKITQAQIADTRMNQEVCGWVTGVIDQVDTTTLFNQYVDWYTTTTGQAEIDINIIKQQFQSDVNQFLQDWQDWYTQTTQQAETDIEAIKQQFQAEFDAWFDGIKDILDENTAGNLLNLIEEHKNDTNNPHNVTPQQIGAASQEDFESHKADIMTEEGRHGLRYWNDKLEFFDGLKWIEGVKDSTVPLSSDVATALGLDPAANPQVKDAFNALLQPQIIVTAPTGSTVTAVSGATTLTATESSGTWVFNIPAYGTWTVTATLSGNTASGTVVVDTVKQYSIALKYIDRTLNNNSWADIHSVSADGANYWSVGDRKAVTLNGTVGTQSINGTYYVYILGFNHNSSIEGTGIHFGGFKTALSGGSDICLIDSKYNSASTDGGKYFNMNHSSGTNTGGWKDCDLRYDVLGSVNSKGTQNAAATTATNPVPNTLMAALPSDLRSVMQPITKYSDNTGGGNDTASYVSTTIDYLPLLAEFEIFGTRTYANSAEKNYQVQYAYFTNGNSKVKYKHNDTATSAYWWERSVCSSYTSNFCRVNSDGDAIHRDAHYSSGVSPAFKV